MTRVKICGITNVDDALAACEAGADALGFVFAEEAKQKNRYLDPDEACRICGMIPPFVLTVGVCVNAPVERMQDYLTFLDRVQLHGEESVEDCALIGRRAIKAFRVGCDFDVKRLLDYPVSAYLLDARVSSARGGTGRCCDWDIAREAVKLGRPIILAGGLTPDNVAEAIRYVRPYAVDTSGGVEKSPGKKDHECIQRFIREVKTALSR